MSTDPLIGRRFANFEVEQPLGRGGMAQVYFGHDIKLRRPVAIKVIDARYRDDPSYAKRFVREAQTIATWRHEHIIQIYYADDQDGFYYFVMEYIDGEDLEKILATHRRDNLLPYEEVVRMGQAVAGALDYAHGKGIIHRDVKPSNILVANDGRVVLTDFGLAMDAEMGSVGEVFGSARYISPEQARNSGEAVPQSDLYSLGVVLYEMLTGTVPFNDPSSTTIAVQHLTMPVPSPRQNNPDLSEGTEAVLLKALSKTPEERYQIGRELMTALEGALNSTAATVASPLVRPRVVPDTTATKGDKRPLVYAGIGAGMALMIIAVVGIGLAAIFLWGGDDAGEAAAGETATQILESGSTSAGTEVAPSDQAVSAVRAASTPTPAASPTSTPEPIPQMLVDTQADFSGAQNGPWRYLWSRPGADNWNPMSYEERRYGPCWYGEDYIRICSESAHPGNGADVAWQWRSNVSGPLEIRLSTGKIDMGGDGVKVAVYHNTLLTGSDAPVFEQKLGGRDNKGFAETVKLDDVQVEDTVLIVINRNGDATSDHTAFRARICHYTCP